MLRATIPRTPSGGWARITRPAPSTPRADSNPLRRGDPGTPVRKHGGWCHRMHINGTLRYAGRPLPTMGPADAKCPESGWGNEPTVGDRKDKNVDTRALGPSNEAYFSMREPSPLLSAHRRAPILREHAMRCLTMPDAPNAGRYLIPPPYTTVPPHSHSWLTWSAWRGASRRPTRKLHGRSATTQLSQTWRPSRSASDGPLRQPSAAVGPPSDERQLLHWISNATHGY